MRHLIIPRSIRDFNARETSAIIPNRPQLRSIWTLKSYRALFLCGAAPHSVVSDPKGRGGGRIGQRRNLISSALITRSRISTSPLRLIIAFAKAIASRYYVSRARAILLNCPTVPEKLTHTHDVGERVTPQIIRRARQTLRTNDNRKRKEKS